MTSAYFDFSGKSISYSLNDGKTMNIIRQRCKKLLIEKLPNYKEYTDLGEYEQMVTLLMKGIAVHHSGIHPILREMIEFMFDTPKEVRPKYRLTKVTKKQYKEMGIV